MPCPLCTGEPPPDPSLEIPPAFIEARAYCGAHGREAELPGGARYVDVARPGDPRLDGPVTSYLLNPVSVSGRAAYALWGGGSFVVREQVFPAADCYEHVVQHEREHLEVLHHLHRDRARFASGVTAQAVAASFAAGSAASLFQRLPWLTRHSRIRAFVREHGAGRPRTAAEVVALGAEMRASLPATPSAADMVSTVTELLEIAGRRFAHLR